MAFRSHHGNSLPGFRFDRCRRVLCHAIGDRRTGCFMPYFEPKSDDILLCTIVTLLATLTASSHWLARPHLFSLPLLLIWYHLLDQFQYNDKPTLKYLPILMLLWVNLHGGFMLGIVLLTIYLAGNLIYSLTDSPASALRHRAKAKALSLTALLTIAACIVNPVGVEIFWFPFRVTSDRFIMDWVIEFMSPNFHQALPFKYMFIAVIAALALARTRLNLIESALLILVSYMALYSVRHVSVFAIVVAPILLRMSSGIADELAAKVIRILPSEAKAVRRPRCAVGWEIVASRCRVDGAWIGPLGCVAGKFQRQNFPGRCCRISQARKAIRQHVQ